MPAQDIKVTLQPITRERNAPGEVAVEVTLTNAATEATTLDLSNAHIPSLALEIRDAAGRKIPMPPPPVPKAGDLRAAPVTLAPGQSHRIRLPVPFDARDSGAYQVRYRHREPAATRATLSTSAASDAITSDWMPVALEGRGEFRDLAATFQPSARIEQPVSQFNRFWCLLRCVIFLVRKKPCNKIASVEVDRTVTEVMTNDPRGDNTYSWNSRFLLSLDQPKCRITVDGANPRDRGHHCRAADSLENRHRGEVEQYVQALLSRRVLPRLLRKQRIRHRLRCTVRCQRRASGRCRGSGHAGHAQLERGRHCRCYA